MTEREAKRGVCTPPKRARGLSERRMEGLVLRTPGLPRPP